MSSFSFNLHLLFVGKGNKHGSAQTFVLKSNAAFRSIQTVVPQP